MRRSLWAFNCRLVLLLAIGVIAMTGFAVSKEFPGLAAVALAAASWRITRRRA